MPIVLGAQSSSGLAEPAEAERVIVLMCVLASRREEKEKVEAYQEELKKGERADLCRDWKRWCMGG